MGESARSGPQRQDAGSTGGVWLRPPRRRAQRETPPLNRDRIVEEAVVLLDEEGVGRLTMRRLAERLGTGSTTLYWHVDTKDDILELALDAVFGEVPLPAEGSGSWRDTVSTFMRAWRSTMLRHPWSAGLVSSWSLLGPDALARSEFLHATLARAGFTGSQLAAAAYGLSNYVIGCVTTQVAREARDEAVRAAGDEHVLAQRDRYPTLAAQLDARDSDWDASFARGLGYLLDGMEAQVGAEASGG